MKNAWIAAVILIVAVVAAAPVAAQVKVDPALSDYKAVRGVSGSVKSVGSDTMNNLMALWAEKFKQWYPNVTVEIEGKGSSTAPPALIAGSSNFGPMSRQMKAQEVDAFKKKFGYEPTQLRTAVDMLAVYVHKDNPIAKTGLTMEQLDAIFSKTRKRGYPEDITTWGQVGLKGAWANKPISLYGRNSASGTYGYFKEHTLAKGDYKDSVKEQPGSSSVVQGVASDLYGIGYSGIGYRTADVAVVPVAVKAGSPFVPAEAARVSDYPLARYLYLTVNYAPGRNLDPLRREFVRLVMSKDGQEVVIKDGYLPVSAMVADQELDRVGISKNKSRRGMR